MSTRAPIRDVVDTAAKRLRLALDMYEVGEQMQLSVVPAGPARFQWRSQSKPGPAHLVGVPWSRRACGASLGRLPAL